MTAPEALQSAIRALASGQSLTEEQSRDAFGAIMGGEASGVQVAALLMAMRVKGETPGEVAGAARALRDAMVVLAEAHDGNDAALAIAPTGRLDAGSVAQSRAPPLGCN